MPEENTDISETVASMVKAVALKIREDWISNNPQMEDLADSILIGSLAAIIALKSCDAPKCVINVMSPQITIAKQEFEEIQRYCLGCNLTLEKSERLIISHYACAITDITSSQVGRFMALSSLINP